MPRRFLAAVPVPRREWPARGERALVEAALWAEVRERLDEPAARLSVGQQQRLCLARTLAVDPEVILRDGAGMVCEGKGAA